MKVNSLALVFGFVGLICALQDGHSMAASSARKPKNEQNCTNHLEIIDRCSSQSSYSYTTSSNPYPTNSIEMKASCDRISEGLKCLRIYSKCMSSLARRTVVAYASSRSKHSKRICANMNDPKTVDFWKSNECIKSSNKTPRMISSERELISTLEFAASNKSLKWEDAFHHACCAAVSFKVKMINDLAPDCSKFNQTQDEFIESIIGELLESACPDSKRLAGICPKLPKLDLPKDWRAVSLTKAALELVVVLSENRDKP